MFVYKFEPTKCNLKIFTQTFSTILLEFVSVNQSILYVFFFFSEIPCDSEEDGLFCSQEILDGSGDYDNDWLNIYNESTPGNCEEPNCDKTSGGKELIPSQIVV